MNQERVIRHKLAARVMHWLMAASVLVLLATGLLPQFGVKFDWVLIHWVTGLVLTAGVAFHIVRASFFQSLRSMGVGWRDIRELLGKAGIARSPAPKPGKYTLAQKAMHHSVALTGLAAVGTGLVMLVKIDTPFWKRNPYVLSENVWGIIYVVHGFASLALVTLIMLHIYFTLRPERFFYLRSMLLGWIRRDELTAHHDPALWRTGAPAGGKDGE